MAFLKTLFSRKEQPVQNYADFWNWFQQHEQKFYKVIKKGKNIDKEFFDIMATPLAAIKEGFYCVTGMYDDNTAELILTADGNIENIVFVEDLVLAAPEIKGWKFTALKPALKIEDVNIAMNGFDFNKNNLFFYANDDAAYPDEIDIKIVHNDLTEQNRDALGSGIYIFLDNYLGELDFVTSIDNLEIGGRYDADKELIPIEKLIAFIQWRKKEFVEKYEGVRHNTDDDNYSILEASRSKDGMPVIAAINTTLLEWDKKASHPWMLAVEMPYTSKGNNGLPLEEELALMESVENTILEELKDFEGYLQIGRETANNNRTLFFACREFRKPSKVMHEIQKKVASEVKISYEIFKDKYWRSVNKFMV